jgi:hypothetical protein
MNPFLFVAATITFVLLAIQVSSQEDQTFCDPYYFPLEDAGYSYKMRDTRCEGVYFWEGFPGRGYLELVSFTRGVEDYDLRSSEPLQLAWHLSKQVTDDIKVVAQGVVGKSHYRMNTQVLATQSIFKWPPEILQELNLTKEHLGVMSWSNITFGEDAGTWDVHFPPTVSQSGSADTVKTERDDQYHLQVVPVLPITTLSFRVRSSEDGRPGRDIVSDSVALGDAKYRYGDVISFPLILPSGTATGYYVVDVIARLANTGSGYEVSLWFFHLAD